MKITDRYFIKKPRSGFTIIELLIVIAVIGILSTIGIVSFINIQVDARDAQRSSKINIISEALEKYFDQNGEYPGCAAMTASSSLVSLNTLKGIDISNLTSPSDTTGVNSITCTALTENGADQFAYVGDNNSNCLTGPSCLNYELQYVEEGTGNVMTISSRRSANLTSLSKPSPVATINSTTQITLNWASVPNADSYTTDMSTSSDFTSPITATGLTSLSKNYAGLSPGTTYYFRVTAVGNGFESTTSNTITKSTPSFAVPTVSTQVNSGTQITISWNAITYAETYTAQISTNSDFSTNTETIGITDTSKVFSSLVVGTTYYFRVKAVATGDNTGSWSTVKSAATQVPIPTGVAAVTNSSTQITASWNAVAEATSYTIEYDDNSGFSSPGWITGLTGTSRALTGLQQGWPLYVRVFALIGTLASGPSGTAGATTTIDTPVPPSFAMAITGTAYYSPADIAPTGFWLNSSGNSAGTYSTARLTAYPTTNCAAGTGTYFQYRGQYNAPATWYGWTNWYGSDIRYMIRPLSPYGVRFQIKALCTTAYAWSAESGVSQVCAWRDGGTTCAGFSE